MKLAPEEFPVISIMLIGSQAHGLARPDSDFDYREVYYAPTVEHLKLPVRDRPKLAWSTDSKFTDDVAGWEVEQLLDMVMSGHPNAVELMFAPLVEQTSEGESLRELRPHLLASGKFLPSTLGYAKNCRNKLLDHTQRHRQTKWKTTFLRILFAGRDFLKTGAFPIVVDDQEWGPVVRAAMRDELSVGDVVDITDGLIQELEQLTGIVVPAEPDIEKVNEWLLAFRERHFYE